MTAVVLILFGQLQPPIAADPEPAPVARIVRAQPPIADVPLSTVPTALAPKSKSPTPAQSDARRPADGPEPMKSPDPKAGPAERQPERQPQPLANPPTKPGWYKLLDKPGVLGYGVPDAAGNMVEMHWCREGEAEVHVGRAPEMGR